jgi:triphosphatase
MPDREQPNKVRNDMTVETELKLHIAPQDLERLRRHPFLKQLSSGRAVTRTLRNIYFDTPDLSLHGHAMALRLRHAGKQWLQTLKGGGGVEAGLHSRNEWETAVAGEALDLPALKAAGGKLPSGAGKQLQPIFSTDFSRFVRQVSYHGAEIELCMDSGEIRAGNSSRPISELELELKSGEPRELFALARELLERVPLQVEPFSKAEYGYRLYLGSEPTVAKASFPPLQKTQDVSSALKSMIAACLMHVQSNVPGAMSSDDAEYLHQVRVGLRRLRVVLAMAKARRRDAELDALRGQANELCEKLGMARDWDVFVTQLLVPLREKFPDDLGLAAAMRVSETNREACRASMRAHLQSRELPRLMLRMGAWLQGDYWQADAGEAIALGEFGAKILRKHAKNVARHGKRIADGAPEDLHALRIACKKLRYSGEMLRPLFKAGAARRYLDAMAALQNVLGVLNDIATARGLLADGQVVGDAATQGLMREWLDRDHAKSLARLGRAWKRFAAQPPFWEV